MEELIARAYVYSTHEFLDVVMYNFKTGGIYTNNDYKRNYDQSEVRIDLGIKASDDVRIHVGDKVKLKKEFVVEVNVSNLARLYKVKKMLEDGFEVVTLVLPRSDGKDEPNNFNN